MVTQAQRLQAQQRTIRIRSPRTSRVTPQQQLKARGVSPGSGDISEFNSIVSSQEGILAALERRKISVTDQKALLLREGNIRASNIENSKLFGINESIKVLKKNVAQLTQLRGNVNQQNLAQAVSIARESSFSEGQISKFINSVVSGDRSNLARQRQSNKFAGLSLEERALQAGAIGQTENTFIFKGGEVSRKEFSKAIKTGATTIPILPSKAFKGVAPTRTEIILKQSLPADQRFLPVTPASNIQAGTGIGGSGGVDFSGGAGFTLPVGVATAELPGRLQGEGFFGKTKRGLESFSVKTGLPAGQLLTGTIGLGEFGFGLATRPKETLTGVGVGIVGAGERVLTGKGFPEIGKFARTDPVGFTARIAGELPFIIGLKTPIGFTSEAKVLAALNRAKPIKVTSKFVGLEQATTAFGVDAGRISRLFGRESRDIVLRKVSVKLKPKTAADGRIIPQVEQIVFEIVARDGTKLGIVRAGEVLIKRGKKQFSRVVISKGEGIIKGETARITTSNELLKLEFGFLSRKFKLVPTERVLLKETVEITGRKVKKIPRTEFKLEALTGKGEVKELISLKRPGKLFETVQKPLPKQKFISGALIGRRAKEIDISLFKDILIPPTKGRKITPSDVLITKQLDEIFGVGVGKILPDKRIKRRKKASALPIFERPPKIKIDKRRLGFSKKELNNFVGVDTKIDLSKIRTKAFPTPISGELANLFAAEAGEGVLSLAKTIQRREALTRRPLVSGRTRFSDVSKVDSRLNQRQLQVQSQLSKSQQKLRQDTRLLVTEVTGLAQPLALRTKQAQALAQRQVLSLRSVLAGRVGGTTPPRVPRIPTIRLGGVAGTIKEIEIAKPIARGVPHNVFIKKRKIASNLTRKRALDFGSFVSDNTIAAQFRIKKSKGKIKRTPIPTPQNYFNFNRSKFRSFKIRKGKRIPLKNRFIEKRNRRLDTIGENQQITAARFLKQRRGAFGNISGTTKQLNKLIGL